MSESIGDVELDLISRSSGSSSSVDDLPEVMKKFLGDISKKSVYQQIGVGATSGVAAGAVFGKVGKMAALLVGGTILVMQVGIHQEFIAIDWHKVDALKKNMEKEANRKFPRLFSKFKTAVLENRTFMLAFTGGFLAGFSYF